MRNSDKYSKYSEFCTGCGLCHSVKGTEVQFSERGFVCPKSITRDDANFMSQVCMSSGTFWKDKEEFKVWGDLERPPFYAYSRDEKLREQASSGGVVSEIAIYLLRNELVDGVIQIKAAESSPIKTSVVVSTTPEEIKACCGSRYAVSSPLRDITSLLMPDKRYAFIGKPCDVMALRNWQKINPKIKDQVPYLISFLCAGLPSHQAEISLLKSLGTDEKNCTSLTYRGNGWPGFAIAKEKDRETGRMSYEDSWGKILGRDVALACRFCYDGIGEAADISCGDGWYIKDGKPAFREACGRNIVFIRTPIGEKIIQKMLDEKVIIPEYPENSFKDLQIIQRYQFSRRTTMKDRLRALKLFHRAIPDYPIKMLNQLAKSSNYSDRSKVFLGTLKRLKDKKF